MSGQAPGPVRPLDERVGLVSPARKISQKVFPRHWTFLLGEVAMVAFGVLVLTGLFLMLFYTPSVAPVVYEGSSELHSGRHMPAAFESIVRLSHDVPGGLLVRRVHRAAAHVFVFAIFAHLLRILFTGAFRRPREVNYHVGTLLLMAAITAAYTGHLLPFDIIAGTSLRILHAFVVSIPLIGPDLAAGVLGTPFPGEDTIGRMFVIHVVVLPAVIAAAMAVHLALVVRQSHTQLPRPDLDGERTIAGEPLWPAQAASTLTLSLVVVGLLAASAAVVPWSDVDLHGPYVLATATNASQPDWYLFWIEGALRLYPPVEVTVAGVTISGTFIVGVALPLAVLALFAAYPFIERRVVGDDGRNHHVLQAPTDVPFRLAVLTGVLTALAILSIAAGADVTARILGLSVRTVLVAHQVAVLVLPPLAAAGAWLLARRSTKGVR